MTLTWIFFLIKKNWDAYLVSIVRLISASLENKGSLLLYLCSLASYGTEPLPIRHNRQLIKLSWLNEWLFLGDVFNLICLIYSLPCIYAIRKNMKDFKRIGEINMYLLWDLDKIFIDLKCWSYSTTIIPGEILNHFCSHLGFNYLKYTGFSFYY